MANNDGYAPNPSDKRFQNMIDAEFSAGRRPPEPSIGAAGGAGFNPDLDSAAARERQEEEARHDYRGKDASDIGGETREDRTREDAAVAARREGEVSGQAGTSTNTEQSAESAESGLAQPQRWDTAVTGEGGKRQGGVKGFVKKRLPTLLIIAALVGGGGALVGSTSLQGFAIVNRMIQEFNSMGTVSDIRSNFLIRRILKPANPDFDADEDIKGTVFDYENFELGKEELANFKANDMNIKEIDTPDGKLRYISYSDGGTTYKITGDADSAKLVDGAIDFNTAKSTVPDFDTKYTTASATYSSQSAGWYDKLTTKLLSRLGLKRNRFSDYEQTGNAETDEENFKKLAKTDEEAGGVGVGEERIEEETDEDGNTTTKSTTDTDEPSEGKPTRTDTEKEVSAKMEGKAKAIAKGIDTGINVGCAVMTILGTINDLANAAEMIQILNFTSGFMEAVQKVQAGTGSESPMHSYLNLLNTVDSETQKSAMNSSGMSMLFGGTFDSSEESAENFNFENVQRKVLGGLVTIDGVTADEMLNCTYARMATGITSLILDAAPIIAVALAPATLGASLAIWATEEAAGAIASVVVTIAVQKVIEFIVPRAAHMIARDLIEGALGPDLGNALFTGGRSYMGSNHRQRGGGGGDEKAVSAFYQETEQVIAHQAEYERATHSPFDATSQYTFLGTLYSSLLPVFTSNNFLTTVANLSSTTFSSMGKLLPSAAAATMDNTKLTNEKGTCPVSDDMGVVSDKFCNPVIVSDTKTMGMDPAKIYKKVLSLGNGNNFKKNEDGTVELDKNGNPVINPNSRLGKYIAYCGQRQTNYGFADANITSAITSFTGNESLDAAWDAAGNAIDMLGDAQQVLEAMKTTANMNWISGLNCVNTSQNKKWKSEFRYYQRYVEDQSTMQAMGVVKQSSVEVALDEWYEEHPLDTSPAGILAFFSGHTKEEVQLALDYIDYYEALAEYNPKNYAPLPLQPPEKTLTQILFDADNLTFVQVQEPLIAGASELERQISLRKDERPVNQSV